MDTSFLYDRGEETWPQKWHLGCGGVYLDGYINCDIDGVTALGHPDLVEQNKTTINNYYARLEGDMLHLPIRRATVYDCISDVSKFQATQNTVDKIVAFQVLEHLTPCEAYDALDRWHRALKHGRPLILSVPDMDGTLELIEKGNSQDIAFALRHLRGRAGSKYHTHKAWYTRETLAELVAWFGFDVMQLPNFHFYPALVIRAVKIL